MVVVVSVVVVLVSVAVEVVTVVVLTPKKSLSSQKLARKSQAHCAAMQS